MKVDDEVEIAMLYPTIANPLFDLIESDTEHLEKWLPGLKNVKTVKDKQDFIAASLAEFGLQK